MDVRWSAEADAYRATVRDFLDANLPSDWGGLGTLSPEEGEAFTTTWRATLAANDLLAVSWPKEYGGAGLSPLEQVVLAEEFAKRGVPTGGPNDVFGIQMLGNTLLQWGTEEQKRHFLPRILSGEDLWCQGYSEPNAGSDLGNLGCRGVRDGDEWVINGQKIWTSNGHLANWIFVLARTDPDAPKHKGITFLLCPMDQPGVEVRPIKMLTGESEFNEVFFDDARCPADNVVGQVNAGWGVAMTLLGHERGSSAAVLPLQFRVELDRLLALAKETGKASDPVIRQKLAWCYSKVEIMRYLGLQTLTGWLSGKETGASSSIAKLYWSEYHLLATEVAVAIHGMASTVPSGRPPGSVFNPDELGAPNSTMSWTTKFLHARAETIYAGTSQIQRNIVGEMVLGLPKEPKADSGSWAQSSR
jgi:alkylation response protein AidB-like acyl-CoA dehydrogenase